jgi:F-type H+-transporting ATPase subunit b
VRRLAFVCTAVLLPAVVLGAGGGGHDESHGIPWKFLAFATVNLAIFLFVLPRLLPLFLKTMGLPASRDDLKSRRADIQSALQQAAKAKEESERLKEEWERRLANLGTEIEALRRQAREEIAAEREQILAAATKLADAIRRDAQKAAEQEVRNAESRLREEVAAQALAISRRLAPQRLTATDHERFVGDFIRQVQS